MYHCLLYVLRSDECKQLFFFFQAEDGIRAPLVTGVQTCALPICMGPLAHSRRLDAVEGFVADAVANGAKVETGGRRIGNKGYFFEPTVLTNVSREARIMNEEPFGPVAVIGAFDTFDEMITEANRLPYGLAAYAYTRSE